MDKIKRMITIVVALSLILSCINTDNLYAEDVENVETKIEALDMDEVPDVIEYEVAIDNKHVKRERGRENGLNEIVFKNQDGTYTLYVYDKNVKFVDSAGSVIDIDTGIEKSSGEKKGYTYSNGANEVNVDFPDIIRDGLLVEYSDFEIKMYPAEYIGGKLSIDNDKAIYDNIYGSGTQLIYTPTLNGVKEEIVLEKYNKKEKYAFIYDIGNGYISTLDDDCLYIYSETDELFGLIEPIYMIDANNKYNANSTMNYYENENGTWTVEIIPDIEFLTAKDTVYPVIIDPTYSYVVNYTNNSTGIQDITINSTSTSAGYSGSLFVGNRKNTENGISEVLMRIPSVNNSICSSIEVQRATVTLRDVMCEANAMEIKCYQFKGSPAWSEISTDLSHLADNRNYLGEEYDSKIVSYANGVSTSHIYSFDITVAVKEWINSSLKSSCGLLFKATDISTVQNKTFASYQRGSYQPTFTMVYVNNTGAFSWDTLDDLRYGYGESSAGYLPNCAGYALGKNISIDENTVNFNITLASVERFAEAFRDYVNSYVSHRTITFSDETEWRKISLAENQYLIATRIGSWDFHFMVQMNDGKWSDKAGYNPAFDRGYIDPDEDANWKTEYTSDTYYMIVTVQ